MLLLHPLSDFIDTNSKVNNLAPTYYYQGYAADGELLQLPRTCEAELIARGLMRQLANNEIYSREGKMYGILLVELPSGEKRILKAFSGLLNGSSIIEGWVPPILGREKVVLEENRTLAELEAIKQEIIQLKQLSQRQQYETIALEFEQRLQEMAKRHQVKKQQRHQKRQQLDNITNFLEYTFTSPRSSGTPLLIKEKGKGKVETVLYSSENRYNQTAEKSHHILIILYKTLLQGKHSPKECRLSQSIWDYSTFFVMTIINPSLILNTELEKLKEESRQDGIERKLLKRQRDEALQPLKQVINNADIRIRELKQQRKETSRKLQSQMHAAYTIMNFLGNSSSLQQLMPQGLPTGTGDCCTPKLLHYAATNNLKPLAIAEFWWGKSTRDKIPGEFYGACIERCQPLMGFLLSGLKSNPSNYFPSAEEIPIIYQDEWLIAVNKPSGLLSVPGRYHNNQDSVVSRLINLLPDCEKMTAVHRLDMDTSGILLLAKNKQVHRLLSKQFEQRLVKKVYEAILSDYLLNKELNKEGTIELPLWGNPENRPYQEVNYQYGKHCITKFKVLNLSLNKKPNYTRIEFVPLTGRTHQLRIHAADKNGLNMPILGDKLYGSQLTQANRLYLHARELTFEHPYSGEKIYLQAETPF
ncbi:23S RNA-specific pseudouridylate synthase [Rivularia sp. PCC 7116]|uniref:RluA family pseudouridine synthase n=1 Tax=Rivularia sp. PCC 7116 TaxID=373994 RepID=UPI00029F3C20|nr:RluA family pseudouridine synthase [Rivularia sp. PCC 7116]AFY57520.1 23S RNA-specific pseudouridylate synthase [Rivularia sp. PCC 7116]